MRAGREMKSTALYSKFCLQFSRDLCLVPNTRAIAEKKFGKTCEKQKECLFEVVVEDAVAAVAVAEASEAVVEVANK